MAFCLLHVFRLVFEQIRGVPIGSPMTGVIAELVLRYKELSLASMLENEFALYVGYVDHIFLVSACRDSALRLKKNLRDDSLGIQLNLDQVNERRVHFLDVGISVESSGYCTTVFRKPTFRPINIWNSSYDSEQYKLAAFRALFRRALSHCSTREAKENEIKIILRQGLKYGFWAGNLLSVLHAEEKKTSFTAKQLCTTGKDGVFLSPAILYVCEKEP